jgi:hypothetical protein
MKTLFMETTKIPVGQTVSQIQRILGEYGACAVMTEYKDKEVTAVCFKVMFLDRDIPFRLPCRWEAVYKSILDRPRKRMLGSEEVLAWQDQSKRIAWRQILRWVEAQMALVETNMVKVHEVFLPYIQCGINAKGEAQTLAEKFENESSKFLLLDKKS